MIFRIPSAEILVRESVVQLQIEVGVFLDQFRLPTGLVGKERIEVGLEVDRTFVTPSDTRALGLVFGSFAIR